MQKLRKPARLRPGDTVAAVSPSSGAAGAFPHRYEAGKRQLEEAFGVRVVEMPHALADPGWVARNPKGRAEDMMAAFSDESIKGVFSTIGGDDSIRVLPFLDLEVLRSNPKVFIGYSDTTVMHMAMHRAGVVSFYGSSIMSGFGENGGVLPYLEQGTRRALFSTDPMGVWPENGDGWTVEHLDWADPENQHLVRNLNGSHGWRWHGGGDEPVEGVIVAGCMEVLDWLRGTPWWPDLDGAILAIETSEEAVPAEYVARFIRSLAAMGDLEKIKAILMGRPGGANLPVAQHTDYDIALLRAVREEHGMALLPLVTGMDFGHTDPAWTIPEGVTVRVDPNQRTVTFVEEACTTG